MQNVPLKIVLILALLAMCGWAIATKEIRLGKDLQGGVSLTYQLTNLSDDANRDEVMAQVIDVLKDRINPRGVMDISIIPQEGDRLEIVMPLPNDEIRALRRAFDDALRDFMIKARIRPADLDAAVADGKAVELYGGMTTKENEGRLRRVRELQVAYDALQQAQDAWETNKDDDTLSPEVLANLQQTLADTQVDYEDARDAVLRLSLDQSRVERSVRLSTEEPALLDEITGKPLRDEATGDILRGPSPRAQELTRLAEEYPHLKGDALDSLVATYDEYNKNRKGFDDPEDLKRLLRGSGVLEYHIGVRANDTQAGINVADLRQQLQESGPGKLDNARVDWYPINDLKQWYERPEQRAALQRDPASYFSTNRNLIAGEKDGEYYLLLYTAPGKQIVHGGGLEWQIVDTGRTVDQRGLPAVSFTLDSVGGRLMGKLTASHVSEPMAIVLDGQVYSAPRINDRIGRNGIITGSFDDAELTYLISVLRAGSLQAQLSPEPVAVTVLGPSIGADNLNRGLRACVIAIIAVAIFMLFYYFFAGFVADLALIANGILIFGVMAMIDGTFTLPGLAGIVLTIGMAVDANVLVYERIREEIVGGEVDLRGAIRLGYNKALSTILDANITNLIVCAVLYRTATTEVKGFALTLAIGIFATLFTTLFVTRIIYYLYTDVAKQRKLGMLPLAIPAIHRALEPTINWIGLRKVFWTFSFIAIVTSISLVYSRGVEMLDTEFRGGVSAIVDLAPVRDADGNVVRESGVIQRNWMPLAGENGVESIVHAIGANIDANDSSLDASVMREINKAVVLTAGPTESRDGLVHAQQFQVKVSNPAGIGEDVNIQPIVVPALVEAFGDRLDVVRPIEFDGSSANAEEAFSDYAQEFNKATRDRIFPDPVVQSELTEFLGGVVIQLDGLTPSASEADILQRIERMRRQPDFEKFGGRQVRVIGLEADRSDAGGATFRSAAVVVYDASVNYDSAEDDSQVAQVDENLAQAEFELVQFALSKPPALAQVSTFSSSLASTLSARANVAVILSLLGILVYIWIRFGSLWYSVAAVAALTHDVIIALGLIAVSQIIGGTGLASALFIEEFRIDLGVVAALLTIIGYSLNDTIVILDRIRENRGKLPMPTADIVNNSINQTISRTVLTSGTTLIAVGIMFVVGGTGIRPFTFCLLIGILVGTYSSVAIAAPLVYNRRGPTEPEPEDAALSAAPEGA